MYVLQSLTCHPHVSDDQVQDPENQPNGNGAGRVRERVNTRNQEQGDVQHKPVVQYGDAV